MSESNPITTSELDTKRSYVETLDERLEGLVNLHRELMEDFLDFPNETDIEGRYLGPSEYKNRIKPVMGVINEIIDGVEELILDETDIIPVGEIGVGNDATVFYIVQPHQITEVYLLTGRRAFREGLKKFENLTTFSVDRMNAMEEHLGIPYVARFTMEIVPRDQVLREQAWDYSLFNDDIRLKEFAERELEDNERANVYLAVNDSRSLRDLFELIWSSHKSVLKDLYGSDIEDPIVFKAELGAFYFRRELFERTPPIEAFLSLYYTR